MFEKQIIWLKEKWKQIMSWLLILVGGGFMVAQLVNPFILILPENVKIQLETWLNEEGGLNDWLANEEILNDSRNNIKKPNWGNLTNNEDVLYQKEFYDFLLANDGKSIDGSQLKKNGWIFGKQYGTVIIGLMIWNMRFIKMDQKSLEKR